MILTVTLNPALDVTYCVDRLAVHSATRVQHVRQRAGGKGVNVARFAAAARPAVTVCATGLAGGLRGEAIRADVAKLGIREEFEAIAGESRQTVTIVDGGFPAPPHPTELREPGPAVGADEWDRFLRRFGSLARDARVVVLSGSLPPGIPGDAYATLTHAGRRAGARVIVDTGGRALRSACAAAPDIIKPNELELGDALPSAWQDHSDTGGKPHEAGGRRERVIAAARALRELGARAVVASQGHAGSVAVTADGAWRVTHPRIDGNPVGAGDALVAGLALAMAPGHIEAADPDRRFASGQLDPAGLALASGLAMASVQGSGDVDPAAAERLAGLVRVRRIGGSKP